MSLTRSITLAGCLFAALATAMPADAQRARGDLQQEMTPAEFKAAGLDKLTTAELAALNNWLQGKVEQVATTAVEEAREQGRQEAIRQNRGFWGDGGSSEPITARLEGDFTGFGKGRIYTLDNGQQWEQTDASTLTGLRGTALPVRITPGLMGVWYMQVEGRNTRAKVRRIK